jgi:YesN/AraC family two-component response regulator
MAEEKYDIVFMDHQMPGMDGVETLEKIRAVEADLAEAEKSIVIVLSANAVNGAREMFINSGFNDFLAKPVQGKDFAECLSKWLKKELIIPVTAAAEESIIPEDFPKFPKDKIDVETAVEAAGGFENWLTIARTFVNSIEEKADLIQEYFLQGECKNYTIQVHALKSAARITGAIELSELAAELEADVNKLQSFIGNEKKTEKMLELYRSYIDLLSPVNNYGQKAESEKQELSKEKLSEIIKSLLEGCADFDLAKVEEEFSLLQKSKLPENLAEKMPELEKAVENIEFDEINQLLENIIAK